MNYLSIYDQLILRAKFRDFAHVEGEWHHAIPKCMGGNDRRTSKIGDIWSNVVKLTYREHVFAHRLLCRIYPSNSKLAYAVVRMTGRNRWTAAFRTIYEADKRRAAQAHSERMKHVDHSSYDKSFMKTDEYRLKQSLANKGRKRTAEQRKRMSDAALRADKSHMRTDEYREKMRAVHLGVKRGAMSDETKAILRGQRLGKKRGGVTNAGRVTINNGERNKIVKVEELQSYLDMGYVIGKIYLKC